MERRTFLGTLAALLAAPRAALARAAAPVLPAVLEYAGPRPPEFTGLKGRGVIFTWACQQTGTVKMEAMDGAGVWHPMRLPELRSTPGDWTFGPGDTDDRGEPR